MYTILPDGTVYVLESTLEIKIELEEKIETVISTIPLTLSQIVNNTREVIESYKNN